MAPNIKVVFSKPDSPVYEPGEKVEGFVVVTTDSDIKARVIELRFRGKSHNDWYDYAYKCSFSKEEYYADNTVSVWPAGGKAMSGETLTAGAHQFPFSFTLPATAPCTFEGEVGWVRYTVFVKIDICSGSDTAAKAMFTVLPKADLNEDPKAQQEASVSAERKIGIFNSKPVTVTARCRAGYVPGERLQLVLDITNKTDDVISKVSVTLEQKAKFEGKYIGTHYYVDKNSAAKIKEKVSFPAGSDCQWKREMIVPSLPPSDLPGCSIIDLKYRLQISIKCKRELQLTLPIRIGTIPLRNKDLPQSEMPPPTYVASVFGAVNAKEKGEDNITDLSDFTPLYGYYDWSNSPYAGVREQLDDMSIAK